MNIYNTTGEEELQIRQIRHARHVAADELRREQPCARCRRPIGPTADYVRLLDAVHADASHRYLHAACRCCELCGEVIAGDYVAVDVKQLFAPTVVGHVHVYSEPLVLERVYYHAACAYQAGLTPPTRGPVNPTYGFATQTADDAVRVDDE